MKFTDKQILFDSFLADWDHKFKNIPFILKYLSSYPELVSKLKRFQPLLPSEVLKSQLEWVSLIAQFDHPLDQEFFKPYWVPIQNDEYDYFIDLSSETLAVFEIHYLFAKPYKWYKKNLIKDIAEFLTSVDDPTIDIDGQLSNYYEERLSLIEDLFAERNLLGIENKIWPEEIDINYAMKPKEETSCTLSGNVLIFKGVDSDFIGLIPFDTEITVQKFKPRHKKIIDLIPKVNTIGGLIFLFQASGSKKSVSFYISFNADKESFAEYRNHVLTVQHNNPLLLNDLIEKYNLAKTSD